MLARPLLGEILDPPLLRARWIMWTISPLQSFIGFAKTKVYCISGSVCRCVVRGRLLPGVLPAVGRRQPGTVLWSSAVDVQFPVRYLPAVRRPHRHERERAARLQQVHQGRKYLLVFTGNAEGRIQYFQWGGGGVLNLVKRQRHGYRRQRKSNVLTGVCLSIIGLMTTRSLLGLVTTRSVRMLLGCFLVKDIFNL